MAKGASTEGRMGVLHNKMTELFLKILQKYEAGMDIEGELIDAMSDNVAPNPAMLGAITKFLKDNSITMDTEQLDELSEMEERLANKRRNRPTLASVTNLPLVNDG